LQKATELQNEAIRCNNRTRFIIGELSACIERNRDLTEALKTRDPAQRLFDALNGRGRRMRNEIQRNATLINAYFAEALQEINERNRINVEALAFVDRMSAELCEIVGECPDSEHVATEERDM
jgi:hypothetical protein